MYLKRSIFRGFYSLQHFEVCSAGPVHCLFFGRCKNYLTIGVSVSEMFPFLASLPLPPCTLALYTKKSKQILCQNDLYSR